MANVFVSYSRESHQKVIALAEDLESLGHVAWLDQHLTGGQAWWDLILEEIRKCEVFAFALGPDALNSPACRSEFTYAANLKKSILPILVGEGVSIDLLPEALAQIQIVDYRQEDRAALRSLARALKALPPSPSLPFPLPEAPPAPVSGLGALREKLEMSNPLAFDDQTGILIKLKHGLREARQREDVVSLLKLFRKREDLYHRVAEEIDSLLTIDANSAVEPKTNEMSPAVTKPEMIAPSTTPELVPGVETSSPASHSSQSADFEQPVKRRLQLVLSYVWLSLLGGFLLSLAVNALLYSVDESIRILVYGWTWSLPAAFFLTVAVLLRAMHWRETLFQLPFFALPPLVALLLPIYISETLELHRFYAWQPRFLIALLPMLPVAFIFRHDKPPMWTASSNRVAFKGFSALLLGLVLAGFFSQSKGFIPIVYFFQAGLAIFFVMIILLILLAKLWVWYRDNFA
jgi:hypothetical protein